VPVNKNFDLSKAGAAEVDHCIVSVEDNLTMFQALWKVVDIDQEEQRAKDAPLRNANLDWS